MSGSSAMQSTSPKNLVILGSSEFAREVVWLINDINKWSPGTWNFIGFIERDDSSAGKVIQGYPVTRQSELSMYLPNLYAVAAVGDPQLRERAVMQGIQIGCRFASLVHPTVQYDASTVTIGPGSIICAGSIMTVNITVGSHVILNLDCTVGHGSSIEDFVTISPGCHLSGNTFVGRSAQLGTGVVTIPKVKIGARSIVGAGAVVVRDLPEDVTAIGVPARPHQS